MSWALYRWTWRLESPLFVGTTLSGSLNRCRLYVPARALWGAMTAELARGNAGDEFPNYDDVGKKLKSKVRFGYLFPAEEVDSGWRAWLPGYELGKGLVWRREEDDGSHDSVRTEREMRLRLLGTRPGTAIDPGADVASEGSLRETECLNTHCRDEAGGRGSPVAMVGYVFLLQDAPLIRAIHLLTLGGDIRYGLGRLRRVGSLAAAAKLFLDDVELSGEDPVVFTDRLLAHGHVAGDRSEGARGQVERLAGWDFGDSHIRHIGGPFWVPGTIFSTDKSVSEDGKMAWSIGEDGLWSRR